jgi:hypothetical protein
MLRMSLFVLIVLISAACNLSATPPTLEPTYTPRPIASPSSLPAATPDVVLPTLLPLPPIATSVPLLGTLCQVYTTYSGVDPNNKLSLRSTPSAEAYQVLRVPNNAQVFLVPGSLEVVAEDYHWLNVIYADAATQVRYQGWMARDSYSVQGVRNPTIPTLRQTGVQAPC